MEGPRTNGNRAVADGPRKENEMTPRRRSVLTCLLAAALLLALGTPTLAAPAAGSSPSLVEGVVDWLAGLGDRFGFALTSLAANGTAAPDLDPNGVTTEDDPVFLLDPDGSQAATAGEGEAAPDLDPDG
jgi:hypothetical protein